MKFLFIIIFSVILYNANGQRDSFPDNTKDTSFFSSGKMFFNNTFLSVNAVFRNENNIIGSHYLFDKWVRGRIVTANGIQIENDKYYYNYDKISNNILLTTDFKEIIEIDKREFKSFVLKDGADEYHFEHFFTIDDKKFFQVLVKSNKYSLYKWTLTKFRRNDNLFNSWFYVDSYFYYVVFPNGRLYKEITLKRKSIEKNLVMEPEKVDAYFSLHQYNEIDEALLIDLINYLNK
ncbi:MAG TPA: hypothetical protein VK787_04015 [Puia sp.]|jgi:hypothetical protein|nr:hypothetical protein [Puia sp.]